MLELLLENSCRKDIKLAKKRGKDLTKLWAIVASLQREEKLSAKLSALREVELSRLFFCSQVIRNVSSETFVLPGF